MIFAVKLFLLFVTVAAARDLSDAEIHRLPKLFHLDDFDRCLSQKDGLYCVGTFELTPRSEPSPVYALIKEHLQQPFSFDRRLLHRGYCLTSRCPANEPNTTLRFEQCAGKLLRKQGLTARLSKLSHCTSHADRETKEREGPDLPQKIFLYVVYFILFLNGLGTCYDVFGGNSEMAENFNHFMAYFFGLESRFLVAWSIPSNWQCLTARYEGAEASFIPIQSAKIILHAIIIYGHCAILHYLVYSHNPELMEKQARQSSLLITVRNGTSIVQLFLLASSFLTGYNLLVAARRSPVNLRLVVKWIVKRIFRIGPVFFLMTAYAATWWPRAGDGPLWTSTVEAESKLCRRKFWSHLLFINNLVDASELCMVQSWAMAAEFQLYLVCLFLTLVFVKLRKRAIPTLAALFVGSCLYNITLAYAAGLEPMIRIIVPENIRILFRGSRTLVYLHLSPTSNLPACLFGLLVAHFCFEHQYKHKKEPQNDAQKDSSQQHLQVKKNGENVIDNGRPLLENDRRVNENGSIVENGKQIHENRQIEEDSLKLDEVKVNGVLHNGIGLRNRKRVHENFANGAHKNIYERNGNGNVTKSTNIIAEGDIVAFENKLHVSEIIFNGNFAQNRVGIKTNGYVTQNTIDSKTNGHIITQNGKTSKTNGDITRYGSKVQSNGHIKQDETRAQTNGYIVTQNGTELRRNGDVTLSRPDINGHVTGNGTELKNNAHNALNGIDLKNKEQQNGNTRFNLENVNNNNELTNMSAVDDKKENKVHFLLRYAHCFTLPSLIAWVIMGSHIMSVESKLIIALYVGMERLMFSVMSAWQLVQIIMIKGPWGKLLSWPGWTVPGRLSLSMVMVHWCISATFVASRPLPVVSSVFSISVDWLTTLVYSYLAAIPMYILVEVPMRLSLDALIS